MNYDVQQVRKEFSAFHQNINGYPLCYLDSGATTLKPDSVINAYADFYKGVAANVHRGAHFLSRESTRLYENARSTVANFLGASSADDIIFTRGTTEAINLVAYGLTPLFHSDDEILITEMEHHSNIIPWQFLSQSTGARIRAIPVKANGDLDIDSFEEMISEKTKLIAITHCSNVLGVINPIQEIIARAKKKNPQVLALVDGAQSVSAIPINVKKLGCDFFAFSGHKLFAPFGIGALYMTPSWMEELRPYQGGGSMISHVDIEKSDYMDGPQKFEAGTPNIGGAIALAEAIQFFKSLDPIALAEYESQLLIDLETKLSKIDGVQIFAHEATSLRKNISSFQVAGAHYSDIAQILDRQGVEMRAGAHCCQPLMHRLGVQGTLRASLSVYSTEEDVDQLVGALRKAKEMLL